jgi:hypothetical protein
VKNSMYVICQGREDIFLSRGSLFPEKRSFEGNKKARLKIVFSSVVYILFFSLLVSEGVIIDSRTDPRSRISLPRLIIIFIINQGQ